MKHIVAATDFSRRSQAAVQRAIFLAENCGAPLTIVHVVDDDQPSQIVEQAMGAARDLLHEQVARFSSGAANCRSMVVMGDPFDGILRTAGTVGADLIVMGTHRRQLLRDVFVGTTIERVIRTGPYPVLMVTRDGQRAYESVLAPVDLSQASAVALKTADRLGMLDKVQVTVVHAFLAAAKGKLYIADAPKERIAEYVADVHRRSEKEVGAFLKSHGFLDRGWQRHVREGAALEVIPLAIETLRPDLVVVGTHGRSRIARIFIGSVTESLLRTVETDVLAVPRSPV